MNDQPVPTSYHTHTRWSDGSDTLAPYVEAARDLAREAGYTALVRYEGQRRLLVELSTTGDGNNPANSPRK